MNSTTLKKICRERELYETPELNEKLYLHQKSFEKIENLEEYTEVRTLWLQCNILTKIENLSSMTQLKCLYLQQNCISVIEGLDSLTNLIHLDLSENRIRKVSGLSNLKCLEKLNLSKNFLSSIDDCQGLLECPSLIDIDISKNNIEQFDGVIELFEKFENLVCFYFFGNEAARNCSNYRKKMVYSLPKLRFLDDRPVKDLEKRVAIAWSKNGKEGEKQVRAEHLKEEQEKLSNYVDNCRVEQQKYRDKMKVALERIKKEEVQHINEFNARFDSKQIPNHNEIQALKNSLKYYENTDLIRSSVSSTSPTNIEEPKIMEIIENKNVVSNF